MAVLQIIFDKENKAYVWTPISRLYYNATEGMMNIDGSTAKMLDKLGFDITIYGNSMNLAERILQMGDAEITNEMINTIEETDIPTHDFTKKEEKRTIGFAC